MLAFPRLKEPGLLGHRDRHVKSTVVVTTEVKPKANFILAGIHAYICAVSKKNLKEAWH